MRNVEPDQIVNRMPAERFAVIRYFRRSFWKSEFAIT